MELISLAECISGVGKDEANITCLWVGAGLIINNRLRQVHHSGAGELDYLEFNFL